MQLYSPYHNGAPNIPPVAAPAELEFRSNFLPLAFGAAVVVALDAVIFARELAALQQVDLRFAALFVALAASACAPAGFAFARARELPSDVRDAKRTSRSALIAAAIILSPLPIAALGLSSAPLDSALLLLAIPAFVLGLPAGAFLLLWLRSRRATGLDTLPEERALILGGLLQFAIALLFLLILSVGGGPD